MITFTSSTMSDAEGPIWSPKGDQLAFVASVVPGKTPEETAKIEKERGEGKSKAKPKFSARAYTPRPQNRPEQ